MKKGDCVITFGFSSKLSAFNGMRGKVLDIKECSLGEYGVVGHRLVEGARNCWLVGLYLTKNLEKINEEYILDYCI